MSVTPPPRCLLWAAVTLACLGAGCAPAPAPVRCQSYDAAALTPENEFAAFIDGTGLPLIGQAAEGIEVSFTLIRPLRGPITLVHVMAEHEAERWELTIPPGGDQPWARCFISPSPKHSSCSAHIANPPVAPGGYYYLLAHQNTLLEAGLSFRLCNGAREPARGGPDDAMTPPPYSAPTANAVEAPAALP